MITRDQFEERILWAMDYMTECWEVIDRNLMKMRINNKECRIRRVAYELYKGKIPLGMWVTNTCKNERCINPDHFILEDPSKRRYRAKLTEEEVREIKNSGRSAMDLVEEYDVAKCTIQEILSGRTWVDGIKIKKEKKQPTKIEERLFKNIKKSPKEAIESNVKYDKDKKTGCWTVRPVPWEEQREYPQMGYNGKRISIHRLAYIAHVGEIPQKMLVCHHCDNPRCINPDHLFLGTKKDNMQDMINKNRQSNWQDRTRRAKLTKEEVETIKGSDKSSYELAKEYPVSDVQIRRIRSGARW